MRFLIFFYLFDHLFQRVRILGTLVGLIVWCLIALVCLALIAS